MGSRVLPFAAVLHVLEEWEGGFLLQMRQFVPGVTPMHFWLVNAGFVALCLVAAVLYRTCPVLALSAIALVGVNALIHLAATIVLHAYSPGLVSALALYVPLTIWTFRAALARREVTPHQARHAALLGFGFMAVPLIFQGVRLMLARLS